MVEVVAESDRGEGRWENVYVQVEINAESDGREGGGDVEGRVDNPVNQHGGRAVAFKRADVVSS